jgi:hypothetical protein
MIQTLTYTVFSMWPPVVLKPCEALQRMTIRDLMPQDPNDQPQEPSLNDTTPPAHEFDQDEHEEDDEHHDQVQEESNVQGEMRVMVIRKKHHHI